MEQMIDKVSIIEGFHAFEKEEIPDLRQLTPGDVRNVFVVGRNDVSERLIKRIQVAGLIDDFAKSDLPWQGVAVFRSDDVPEGSLVINCSTSISPLSVDRRIRSIPGLTCIPYADLCRSRSEGIDLPNFVKEARQEWDDNAPKYDWLFSVLKDSESRSIFNKLMSYRLTSDYRYMEGFTVRVREQYFEGFLGIGDDCIFADCGGYDGDSTEEFIRHYPRYKKVLLFEPSIANIEKAKTRLQVARDIDFISLGLSDSPGTLFFNPYEASASAVSSSGSTMIEVTTLDSYVDEPLSLIKMDLEGWELKALHGSQRHLATGRPTLAIAVYHSISDFWKIPEYILSICEGYDVHLRHYTEGWSETVMYFIPRR